MQRPVWLSLILVLTPACATVSDAAGIHPADAQLSKARFERIKSLAGEWTGPGGAEMNGAPLEVSYRVTAGGSAVEETISPGSEHEMVTMYHLDGGKLMLTHYCMVGNQPRMVAAAGGDVGKIRFEFAGATNLASPNDPHMHQMEMTLLGKDHLKSQWTFFKDGKPAEEARFDLTRKTVKVTQVFFDPF
jgi:hypothetical protein